MEEILLSSRDMRMIWSLGYGYSSNFQGSLFKYLSANSIHQIFWDNQSKKGVLDIPSRKVALSVNIPEKNICISLHAENSGDSLYSSFLDKRVVHSEMNHRYIPGIVNASSKAESGADYIYSVGDVLFVNPKRLVDGVWKIGGVRAILKLIDESQVCRLMLTKSRLTSPYY